MNTFEKAKIIRRQKRAQINSKVKAALKGLTPRNAKLTYDLTENSGYVVDKDQNAYIKSVQLVSELLDTFSLPSRPKLTLCGMIKNATSNDGSIKNGIIRITAIMSTLMGHKASIDIPVIIKDKSLLEPAVFFYDGAPYVLCKPALDQLVKRGTLQKEVASRSIFSAPLEEKLSIKDVPRQPIINLQHMYSPGSMNPWKFRRFSQVEKEQRERTNIDTPTEMPELWGEYTEDQLIDPAERCREELCRPGCAVAVDKDFEVRERGGGSLIIPSGEEGVVIKDVKGDGMCMEVQFPVLEIRAIIPVKFLKEAQLEEWTPYEPETKPLKCAWCFEEMDEPAAVAEGEKICQKCVEWAKTNPGECSPEQLKDLGIIRPIQAATIDQVKNEIRDMLREGYQGIDIKATIKQKYPEHAEEALKGLN